MRPPQFKKPEETLLTAALREGKRPIVFAALFSLVSNLLFLALPIYTNQVYGRVLMSHSVPTLIVLTFITVCVFLVSGCMDFLRAKILTSFGAVFDQRISGQVFTALFEGVVQREAKAGAQALRDLDLFRQNVTGSSINVLFDIPWMPIFLIILFVIDPLVGAITMAGSVVLLVLAYLQDQATRPLVKAANNASLQSYGFTEATLRNSEVVRAMGMLPSLGAQWGKMRVDAVGKGVLAAQRSEFWGDMIKFVRLLIQILIIAVGAYLIIEERISSGLLFANMILSSRALAPIERTVGTWPSLVAASQAFERLNELFRDYTPPASATALPKPAGHLQVEGASVMAPDNSRLILSAVSFGLPAGQFLGVIGPSGAGKSTLIRLLVGVWKPLSGSVRLDGSEIHGWSRTDFGRHVGYLPQDTELFAGSVRNNIARFLPDVSDEEVIAAAKMAGAHDLIVRLPKGYDTELGQGGASLSVGQRQRVGLARALLRDPAFVVLDEPNANLDAEGEAALVSALAQAKQRGSTIVVVSHKPSLLTGADRLLVLRDGKIDIYGPRQIVLDRLAAANAASPRLPESKPQ